MLPAPTNHCPPSLRLPLLISYAYLRKESDAHVESIVTDQNVELLVDSGAFTALNTGSEIALDEYMEFCQRWQNYLFGYMALDVIGNPQATARNLRVMIKAGLRPIPVHVLGDGQKKMDELFDLSPWVALGGLRRPHRGPAPLPYVKQKMQWARGRRVHWLGFTEKRMLQAFRPFSCDCSSWTAGMMYGRVAVYCGRGRWVNFTLAELRAKRAALPVDLRRALSDYEIPLKELLDEAQWHNGNCEAGIPAGECVISKLPARSWARYVLDFKLRYGVRLFLASNSNKSHWLVSAHELVIRKGLVDENKNLRDDTVRMVSPVGGSAGGSLVPALAAQAYLPRPR